MLYCVIFIKKDRCLSLTFIIVNPKNITMRLSPRQKKALEKAIENVKGEIFLFGSRVNNQKRGGDIDILIFSEEDPYRLSLDVSVNFFKECEEKIDVIVLNPNKLTPAQKAFLRSIEMEKIK